MLPSTMVDVIVLWSRAYFFTPYKQVHLSLPLPSVRRLQLPASQRLESEVHLFSHEKVRRAGESPVPRSPLHSTGDTMHEISHHIRCGASTDRGTPLMHGR